MSHHAMPFGTTLLGALGVRFRLWAPGAERVDVALGLGTAAERHPMQALAGGWHELEMPQAGAGTRYHFVLPDGLAVPDPASRFNPDDIRGPSEVVDPHSYAWQDALWRGRPWHEAAVYELHVGTFTKAGTFAAAAARLAEIAGLGFTVIELMPLADFPGRRNWGYDGVLHYAPDSAYGTPDQLKALIDTAHRVGLMVLIDVVYNHFGPEGNYLHAYCPQFFNPAHHTPWGAAINYDGEMNRPVRDFMIHNALYWVEEFHADGLRMDAIHAIRDDSTPHIVEEIATALRDGPGRERAVHLVLENDANQARFLARTTQTETRVGSAQWNDDFHHAAHVLTTGERDGYYADYADDPVADFARALAEGFVYQGQASAFRDGEARGEPSAGLPSSAFVSFLQTHDQIGNRAFGDRIAALADPSLLSAAYACVLLSPHVPMLFMGEEWAASTPFLYFCDFEGELAAAVAKGRRAEFGRFAAFADEAAQARIPDPNDEATFMASKLRWDERDKSPHRERLTLIRELLAVRRRHLTHRLAGQRAGGSHETDGGLLRVSWRLGDGSQWHLAARFGGTGQASPRPRGECVYASGAGCDAASQTVRLESGDVIVTVEEAPRG